MIPVTRTITRQLGITELARRRRPLVLQLVAGGHVVRIKVKGSRHWYTVPLMAVYQLGAQIAAERLRAERAAKRMQRRQSATH